MNVISFTFQMVKNLLGLGPSKMNRHIRRRHPKKGEKWCPICRGRGTIGPLGFIPCLRCDGKGKVPIEPVRKVMVEPLPEPPPRPKLPIDVAPRATPTRPHAVGPEPRPLKGKGCRVGSLMLIGCILGTIAGFVASPEILKAVGGFHYAANPIETAGIGALIGALGLPTACFILGIVFQVLFALLKLALWLVVIAAVVLFVGALTGAIDLNALLRALGI